ncbi:MAG TPA: hypothetical protein P5040_00165 [Smithella sp.]|nr:hypothetical protein [Smithella sp.]HRS96565.1 hypothetical protein [Smithella sp.]
MKKAGKIVMMISAVLILSGFALWDVPRNQLRLFLERNAIEKTAHDYLRAEMKKDFRQVYDLLAPSSDYRKAHSYEAFLKDTGSYPPMTMDSYKIVRICHLRDNDVKQRYPEVEKFVQVEVDVTFAESGPDSIFNYSFTFLKEKGRWYKG